MIRKATRSRRIGAALLLAAGLLTGAAGPEDTITLGMSLPLSGAGAVWGRGAEWMCNKAAAEINAAGGVTVQGKSHKVACLAYDNKYTAAEGTKVAHTLLDRDGIKYVFVMGTAPILATQALTERQGALLINLSWGKSSKGPNFPLTFSVFNSPSELVPGVIKYIGQAHPAAKSVVMINVNDATGHESEAIARPMWERAGYKVLTSDFYERGTTEFQPIALRLASYKADIVDLTTPPPPDAGLLLKELDSLGVSAVKILDNGGGIAAIAATGGLKAIEGLYMAGALTFDGPNTNDHQRKINEEAKAGFGDQVGLATISGYDGMYELVAGITKAQSLDPRDIAKALPGVRFHSFYGEAGFGGKADYGSVQQPLLPVYITQVVNGKLVDKAKVEPPAQ